MEHVGKCLLFYLKNANEMERLYDYDGDEPNVDGLDNPDEILEKVNRVGEAACDEAASLLMSCVGDVESHFQSMGRIERLRSKIRDDWDVKFRVTSSVGYESRFQIGVCIHPTQSALMPWLWCRRGRRVATSIIQTLGRGETDVPTWDANTIALDSIEIAPPQSFGMPVMSRPLIERVQMVFTSIDKDKLDRIGALVAG